MGAAWIPYAIQGGEALVLGLVAFFGTLQVSHDWSASLSAGVAAALGKGLPSQILGPKQP